LRIGNELLARFLKRPPTEAATDEVPALRAGNGPKISVMAFVDPKAHIGDDCEIGPFCWIGPDVTLGSGCRLPSNVVLTGRTTIGVDNIFHPHCTIGSIPQDKKYRGEPTELTIGDRNTFRELVTVNTGTVQGGGFTRIGDDNLLMINAHIGHDCVIGNRNVLGNNLMLAGHMMIGNNVVISGAVGSHHYVTIGDYAFIAGMAQINKDVPPFVKVADRDKIRGVNAVALDRAGFTPEAIDEIKDACRKLFLNRERTFAAVMKELEEDPSISEHVKQIVEFMRRRNKGKNGRYLESLRVKK
jgi:UDP-N-acetylglucosamine acyltransferase